MQEVKIEKVTDTREYQVEGKSEMQSLWPWGTKMLPRFDSVGSASLMSAQPYLPGFPAVNYQDAPDFDQNYYGMDFYLDSQKLAGDDYLKTKFYEADEDEPEKKPTRKVDSIDYADDEDEDYENGKDEM